MSSDIPPGPLLSGRETARLLNIDPKTLRKYLRDGVCPVAPVPGLKPPKWYYSDVMKFVASCQGSPDGPVSIDD